MSAISAGNVFYGRGASGILQALKEYDHIQTPGDERERSRALAYLAKELGADYVVVSSRQKWGFQEAPVYQDSEWSVYRIRPHSLSQERPKGEAGIGKVRSMPTPGEK